MCVQVCACVCVCLRQSYHDNLALALIDIHKRTRDALAAWAWYGEITIMP